MKQRLLAAAVAAAMAVTAFSGSVLAETEPAAQPAPAGCVWAAPADLEGRYALPAAFAAYRKFLLET